MLTHYIMKVGDKIQKIICFEDSKKKEGLQREGSIKMNSLLIMNWLAAIAVIAYAGYLFVYLIRTRMAYIQLGKRLNLTVVLKSVGISLRSMFSVRKSC